MARLPDIRLDDWWNDQQQQFREKTEGLMPALDFELQARDAESQIPPDYDAPGGMDQWKQAEQSLIERGLAADQHAEQERRRQEEEQLQEQLRLEQAQAQQKQQDEAHQNEMSMLDHARSLGIPTPEDAFKDFQEPGDHTSTTGIFDAREMDQGPHELPPPDLTPTATPSPPPPDPTPEPLTDVEQFNNHASSMLSDTFGPPPEPDQTQPPPRDDTSSAGLVNRIGSAVTSGAQVIRSGADQLGTAIEENPSYRALTQTRIVPDVVGYARKADEVLGNQVENYGAGKTLRGLERQRELENEITQFQPSRSLGETLTSEARDIPEAWAQANPEKAAELEELRKSKESLIMGASGTMGAGGAAEEAFGAIKALLAHGLDEAALSAERGMAEKTSMTLAEIQAKTRGIKPAVQAAAEAAPTSEPSPSEASAVAEAAPEARSAYEAAQDTFPHRIYSPESRGLTPDEARQMGLPGFEEVMPPQGRPGGTNIPGFGNLPRSTDRAEGGIGERGADFIRDVLPPSQRLSAAERDKRSADLLNTTPERIRALLDQEVDPVQVGVEQGALRRYSSGAIGRFEEAGDELTRLKPLLQDALETAGGKIENVPADLKNEIAHWENEYALRGNTAMEAVHGVTARSRAASKTLNAQKGMFEGANLVEEAQRLHDLGTAVKTAAKTVRRVAGKAQKAEDVPEEVFEELRRVADRLENPANKRALTRKPGTGVGEEGLAPSGPATPRAPREETMVERMGRLKREQGMLENALTQSHSAHMEGPATTSLPRPEHMVDESARGLISDRLSQVESEINEIRDQYRAQASERIQKALEAKANQEPLTPQELQRIADETVGRSAFNRITREESRKAKGLTGDEAGLTRDIQKGISKHYKDAQSAIEKEFEKLFGDNVRLEAKTKLWHDRRVDGILSTEKKATTRREVKNLAEQAQEWAKNLRDDANPNLKPERRAELEDLKKDFDFQEELDAVLGQMKAHSQVGERVANDLGERLGVNMQEDVYNRLFQEGRRTARSVEDAHIQSVVDQIREVEKNTRGPDVHLQIAKLYQELESLGDRGLKRASDLRRHANERGIMKAGLETSGLNYDAIVGMLRDVDPSKPESMKKLFAIMRTPNWWDIARELSFVNLLSDPLTHLKNIVSTGVNMGLKTGFRNSMEFVGSGGQTKGQRAAFEGMYKGTGEGWDLAKTTMATGINPRRLEHAAAQADYSHVGREFIPEMMGKEGILPLFGLKVAKRLGGAMGENIHKMSTRPLEAMDAMLGHMAYTSAIYEKAQQHADDLLRSGTTDIPRLSRFSKIPEREQLKQYIIDNIHDFPEVIKAAGKIEDFALFRSKPEGYIGDMLRLVSRVKDTKPGDGVGRQLGAMFADFVLPFQNVPYNFTKQGLENVGHGIASPVNIPRAIGKSFRGDRKEGGELFAKASQGAIMLGAPITLAYLGDNLTGPGPKDPAQRQIWLEQHRPNSWRTPAVPGVSGPGPWISYEGMPWAVPFAIVAGTKEGLEYGKEDPNESTGAKAGRAVQGAVKGGIQGALSQSLVEGAMRNLEIFGGDVTPNDIATFVSGAVSRYSPHPLVGGPVTPPSGMLSFLARIADSVERDTGKASSFDDIQEVAQNQLEARVPGLRQELPERRGAYGEVVPRPFGAGALGYLGHAQNEGDTITQNLADLKVGVPKVSNAISVNGHEMPITMEEQRRLQQRYGEIFRTTLEGIEKRKETSGKTYTAEQYTRMRLRALDAAQRDVLSRIPREERRRRILGVVDATSVERR